MVKAAFPRAISSEILHWDDFEGTGSIETSEELLLDDELEDTDIAELSEARTTHGATTLHEISSIPQVQELATGKEVARTPSYAKASTSKASTGDYRQPTQLEEKHKDQLKKLYAWHCQICLATQLPAELAPLGSYGFLPRNRICLIKAHHPDQVHARGARHGGNLLILCQHHHLQFGDSISRSLISDALRASITEREITFPAETGEDVRLNGVVITINLPTTGTDVDLFFSEDHRKYWLEH